MRVCRVVPAFLALAALWFGATDARAEVIDYNPITTAPPQILAPSELLKYEALLRTSSIPSITTSGVVPGPYVLWRLGGQYQIMDTRTEKSSPFDPAGIAFGTLTWTSPTTAIAYGNQNNAPVKVTMDFAAGTIAATPVTLPTIEGKRLVITGRLIQTADGRYHVVGYTLSQGVQAQVFERPSFDVRTREEKELVGQAIEPAVLAATPEQIVAVGLDDGALTTVATLPMGANVSTAASSLSVRPGTNTAAYLQITDQPSWTGAVVGGRANRGGFMPPSYYSTRENLGLVPEAENRWLTGRRLVLTDIGTGQDLKVIENVAAPGGMFLGTFWTADGGHLVVRTAIPAVLQGRAHPIYEYYSGTKLRLYAPDGSFEREWRRVGMDGGAGFSPISGSVIAVVNPENLSRSVYQLDLSQPEPTPVKLYDGSDQVYLYSVAIASDKVVAVRGDVTDPGDLYVGDTGQPNTTMRRLTDTNATLKQTSNIKFQPITYTTASGYTVTGVYVYPGDMPFPPEKPMPVVVWQQGGPGGQMTNTWGTSIESPYSLLPNFGIPVFIVNGAGRTSNGADFYAAMADGRNYGTRDILDVKDGVDHLIAQKIVDPKAVGVTGCSYGGYFALQSITQLPDYYAAANGQCNLNDVMWEFNFGWSPFLAYLVGNTTTADPAEYVHDSPIYGAYKIKTPLLLFHGTHDFLPFEHVTNIHDQVVANGTPARFLRAYRRGHGFGQNSGEPAGTGARAQNYGFQLQLSWFREHLGIKAVPRFALSLPGLRPDPVRGGLR